MFEFANRCYYFSLSLSLLSSRSRFWFILLARKTSFRFEDSSSLVFRLLSRLSSHFFQIFTFTVCCVRNLQHPPGSIKQASPPCEQSLSTEG